MIQWIRLILQNLGFQVSGAPTPIHEYSQPAIDIIEATHLTIRVIQISVPIHHVCEKYVLLTIYPVKY